MADPKLAQFIGDQFGSAEQAAKAKPWVYSTEGEEGRVTYSGGTGGGGFYGGGGGAGAQRGGERKTLWTSSFGKALYGAYIAKRMWSWTAQPMIQKATEYGQYMASMAPMAGDDVMSSDVGYSTRQQLAKEYMAEGAHAQFGGFSDWVYSLSGGSGALPRITAGAGLAAGVATAGMVAGTTASIFGGSQAAASLTGAAAVGAGAMGTAMTIGGAIGVGAGVGMAAGLIGMEAYNAWWKPPGEKEATFGNVWARTATGQPFNEARAQFLTARGYYPSDRKAYEEEFGEITSAQLSAEGLLTYEQAAGYEVSRAPIDEEIETLKDLTAAVASKMGAKSEEVQPGIRQIVNATGKVSPGQLGRLADTAQALKMTFPEMASTFTSVYTALGIEAGSQEASMLLSEITRVTDQAGLQDITTKAAQQARYSGMLSSYYEDPLGAQAFVSKAGIDTMAKAQPLQQMMAASLQYGVAPETVMERRTSPYTQFGYEDITYDQMLDEMTDRIGPKRAALAGAVAPKMMARGMGPVAATSFVETLGIETGMQWAAADTLMSGAEQFGQLSTPDMAYLSMAGQQTNMFQANLFAKMAPSFQMAGVGSVQAMGALASSGMSDYDAVGLSKMLGGDLHEWSRRARTAGDWSYQMFDQGGMPIEKTSGIGWSNYVAANMNKETFGANYARENILGMGTPQRFGAVGAGMTSRMGMDQPQVTGVDILDSIFGQGTTGGAREAFQQAGTMGMGAYFQSKMAGLSAASAAVSIASIHETQAFYWGESGTWDDPQRGSMWNLQDRMSGLQQKAAKADFRASRQRMDMNNRYAIRQEGISLQRMTAGHDYQRWTQQFQQDAMQQRQDWTRKDWKYQDTMQALGTEWQLEDYEEALRTSHGRDRRKVYTSRERFLTKTNLETEQKDTKRGQQEKLWEQEEERFKKQIKYSEQLMSLDTAQYNLGRERRVESYEFELEQLQRKYDEYMEQLALEEQMRELEREHQANQLEFQLQQAGIQAAMAAVSAEQAEYMLLIAGTSEVIAKNIKDFVDADPTAALEALKLMAVAMAKTELGTYEAIGSIFDVIRRTTEDKYVALDGVVSSINKIDVGKLQAIIDLLSVLGN
jgi:hypothetical protein